LLKIEQRKRQLLQQLQQTFDDADRELLALESQKNELTQQLKQRLLSEIGTDDIKTRLSDKEEEF
jgi:flagellar biosynthesis chaperone FliJ